MPNLADLSGQELQITLNSWYAATAECSDLKMKPAMPTANMMNAI